MVTHTCNPSTQKAEAMGEGWGGVQGQPVAKAPFKSKQQQSNRMQSVS